MKTFRPLLNSSLLIISLSLITLSGFSQQTLTSINGWNAYVHLPDDYNSSGRHKYPAIIFFPGTGEVGTDASKLLLYGPSHFIAQGNNMNSFDVNGKTIKPIIISVQPTFLYPQPWQLNLLFDAILSRWRIDPSQLNLTGLSMGGFCGDNFVTSSVANASRINSMVNMSAVIPNFPIYNFSYYALTGGKAWWFEGLYDNRGMDQMAAVMNFLVPGSARYTSYVGGHCCWNQWYDPSYTENVSGQNWNIYQWMLAQSKTLPTVDAGADQSTTLPPGKVNLAGTAFGNGGARIASVSWTQISGPAQANIQSPDRLSTKVRGLQPGVYVFMLTVTDDKGISNSSSVTITVGSRQQPTVNPGNPITITLPTNQVTLSGKASGNRGATITSTSWTQTSGPNTAVINSASNLSTLVSGLVSGVYIFQLSATDDNGLSNSATVSVTVNAAAFTPPTVSAGTAQTITLPASSVTLNGTASGNNGAIISSVVWSENSGPGTATINNTSNLSTSVTGLIAGVYVFKLTAKDNNGLSASSTLTVTVSSSQPPSVSAGTIQVLTLPYNSINLAGTASGNNGTSISSTVWSENSGPNTATIVSASSLSTAVNGLVAGNYVFKLTASDNKGQSNSSTVTVIVNPPVPPTVYAGPAQSITLPASAVTLSGSATGNYGASVNTVAWTQSSGPNNASMGTPSNLSTKVSGLTKGIYIFKLTAVDNDALSSTATVTITVNPSANVPPTVDAGVDKTVILPVSSVSLTGTASGNNGASIASILWSETSGPNGSSIASSNSLSTNISGLVQGVYIFQLLVTDNNGSSNTSTATVTVNAAILPPSVNAGTAITITLPITTATLTGTASGRSGASISSTSWSEVSGPNSASLTSVSSLSTGVSGLIQGVYVFKLTANDNNGQSNSGTVSVTVNASANVPPSVNAGTDQTITLPVSSVTLQGTASGNNGASISSTGWKQTGGPNSAVINSPSILSTPVTGLLAGVYSFELTATDNNGLSSVAAVTVTVKNANTPPSVNAGKAQSVKSPSSSVTLTGTVSGTNGATISTVSWTQTSGPNTANISAPANLSTAVSGLIEGVYGFKLTATDNNGLSNSSEVMITVIAESRVAPNVNAGPAQTITLPVNSVVLTGTASGNNGATISNTTWTQTSGPNAATLAASSKLSTSASGLDKGVYTFQLSATDNNGLSNNSSITVTVNAEQQLAPTVNAGPSQTITLPTNSVTLSGTAKPNNGASIASMEWKEVSGPNTAIINTPGNLSSNVTGLIEGTYTFTFTVIDDGGLTSSSVLSVTVNPVPNQLPVAKAGPDQTITMPVNSVTLDGTGSFDPDGSIVSYSWEKTSGSGGITIVNSNTAIATADNLQAGQYVFELTVTDNSGASANSQVTITVNPPIPQAPIANAGNDTTIALPADSTVLNGTASLDSNGRITAYQWLEVSGPTNATISSSNSAVSIAGNLVVGDYVFELIVTNNAGMSARASVKVKVVAPFRYTSQLLLYPNPAHDLINLHLISDSLGTMIVKIYDLNGRVVQAERMVKQQGYFDKAFNISRLSHGMYIFEVIVGTQNMLSAKFIKVE